MSISNKDAVQNNPNENWNGLWHRRLSSPKQKYTYLIQSNTATNTTEELINSTKAKLNEMGFSPNTFSLACKQMEMKKENFSNASCYLANRFFEHKPRIEKINDKTYLIVKNLSTEIDVAIDTNGNVSKYSPPGNVLVDWVCTVKGKKECKIRAFLNHDENAVEQAGPTTLQAYDKHARAMMCGFAPNAFTQIYQLCNALTHSGDDAGPKGFLKLCQQGRITVKETAPDQWIVLIDSEQGPYSISQEGITKKLEPLPTAVCLTAAKDDQGAFGYDFASRKSILEQSGFAVHFESKKPSTLIEAEKILSGSHPNGCNYLLLRMHGSQTTGFLSDQVGGKISINPTVEDEKSIRKICETVLHGGVLVVESCQAGNGEDNLLKFLAGHCHPGVLVIGSKKNIGGDSVQVASGHPKDIRFLSNENGKSTDATRIYYQSSTGPVEISISELDAMLSLFGREELDLCCQFLGERQNPEVFAQLFKECRNKIPAQNLNAFKETLRALRITQSDSGTEWQEMLTAFALQTGLQDFASKSVEPKLRQGDITVDQNGTIGGLHSLPKKEENAFSVLLGMASLDTLGDLLRLTDLEKKPTGHGFAAQCIHALSGLSLHVNPLQPLTTTLASYLDIMQASYQKAKETYCIKEWAEKILSVQNPCIDSYVEAMTEFMTSGTIETSKRERIQGFIKEADVDGLKEFMRSNRLSIDERATAIIDAVAVEADEILRNCLLCDGDIPDEKWDEAIKLARTLNARGVIRELEDYREFWRKQKLLNWNYQPR